MFKGINISQQFLCNKTMATKDLEKNYLLI